MMKKYEKLLKNYKDALTACIKAAPLEKREAACEALRAFLQAGFVVQYQDADEMVHKAIGFKESSVKMVQPLYKEGDVVWLKPYRKKDEPMKVKLIAAGPGVNDASYLVQFEPFNRKVDECGDDCASGNEILGLAT
jgi:hypothetical protein